MPSGPLFTPMTMRGFLLFLFLHTLKPRLEAHEQPPLNSERVFLLREMQAVCSSSSRPLELLPRLSSQQLLYWCDPRLSSSYPSQGFRQLLPRPYAQEPTTELIPGPGHAQAILTCSQAENLSSVSHGI